VSVDSADRVAERARGLGATAEDPFDILDAGRMTIIRDSAGAVIAAWQSQEHLGAGRVNDVGCMAWNELQTREPEEASRFYSALFGWEMERMEENDALAYVLIKNNSRMNGGIMPVPAGRDMPASWLPYFTVASCDAAVTDTRRLGGDVLVEPFEPGEGRISVLSDPQGAAFAIFEGETDE
jgi:predicted enzyme related to lactoylglutathione lyase